MKQLHSISIVTTSRGQFVADVEDTDWTASDRPVILTSKKTVVVTDLDFGRTTLARNTCRTSGSNDGKDNYNTINNKTDLDDSVARNNMLSLGQLIYSDSLVILPWHVDDVTV